MKVAFYGRVSTEEQADRGNITGQVEFARKYFDLHKDMEKIEGYEMYLDEGISGVVPLEDRPEGFRLLSDAREGKFAAVYFYRLDRLARSTQVVLNIYHQLEELNISIKSMTESFDTGTPVGKFFMTLLASMAALERDTILERTLMGKERKAREGCWTSGSPPFGYRIGTDKKLVVHDAEAETVRLIFRMYNEGLSMVPLAEYLNAISVATPNTSKNFKAPSTGKWHAGHISKILRTTAYTGEYETMQRSRKHKQGEVLKIPAIISRDDYNQAQKMLLLNKDLSRGSRGRVYLLKGLIFCGHCGRAMVGSSSGRLGGNFYYRCTGTINRGAGRDCFVKQIRADQIEQIIWDDIVHFLNNPGAVLETATQRLHGESRQLDPVLRELEVVENFIQVKKNGRAKVLSMAARSLVTEEECNNELLALSAELNLLNERRDALFARQLEIQSTKNRMTTMSLTLEKMRSGIRQLSPNREVINLLVERVEVYTTSIDYMPGSHVKLYYGFNPGMAELT